MKTVDTRKLRENSGIKLFEDGVITLSQAAKLADMPLTSFLEKLTLLGIPVVDQSLEELAQDLQNLE